LHGARANSLFVGASTAQLAGSDKPGLSERLKYRTDAAGVACGSGRSSATPKIGGERLLHDRAFGHAPLGAMPFERSFDSTVEANG
jgi:hypothetical protein